MNRLTAALHRTMGQRLFWHAAWASSRHKTFYNPDSNCYCLVPSVMDRHFFRWILYHRIFSRWCHYHVFCCSLSSPPELNCTPWTCWSPSVCAWRLSKCFFPLCFDCPVKLSQKTCRKYPWRQADKCPAAKDEGQAIDHQSKGYANTEQDWRWDSGRASSCAMAIWQPRRLCLQLHQHHSTWAVTASTFWLEEGL